MKASAKVLPKMMTKNDRMVGGYYRDAYGPPGESEASGSSGRIDPEITGSEDSSTPARKCISLNSAKRSRYGVPLQVLPLSKMSSSERKDLIHKLKLELEHTRMLQKKVEFQRTNGITMSASSDILSCSNGKQQQGSYERNFGKSSLKGSGPGKKVNPSALGDKERGWARDTSGRFESAKQGSIPTLNSANKMLMKQCEDLLKRVMSHQYGWVFNHPVDVVKLNLPDYFKVIKHPMDLGTVKSKIAKGAYVTPSEFVADVRLTFSNAMTYNPAGNDVHVMADALSKFFEVRWKNIEKKIPTSVTHSVQPKSRPSEVKETSKIMPPAKKRKTSSLKTDIITEPFKRKMTDEEKHNLGRELESLLVEMPVHIIDFLKAHSSNGGESGGEEIEIDIDDLSDDTLFRLRELIDDYMLQKRKNQSGGEPCEIELLNESGLSNTSMHQGKGNEPDDEDIDIGDEPPVSSYPPVEIEKDTFHRSTKSVNSSSSRDSESRSPESESKGQDSECAGAQIHKKDNNNHPLERNQSISGLDQLEQNSHSKPSSVESDSRQDGESAPSEKQVSPDKLRAALLMGRFADTILKAQEKTLTKGVKGDPEKLRREREELELKIRKEAKAAEDARRRAEAEEIRRKRELEREAARQSLLQMEKTVEINENSQFLKDLEMFSSAPPEPLPGSADETSPDHSLDGLGSFKFGSCNPLEQLGLYMRQDDEEEEGEPPSFPTYANDVEEGEID